MKPDFDATAVLFKIVSVALSLFAVGCAKTEAQTKPFVITQFEVKPVEDVPPTVEPATVHDANTESNAVQPPQQLEAQAQPPRSVYVLKQANCAPCVRFDSRNGKGGEGFVYRSIMIDRPKPTDVDDATWNRFKIMADTHGTPVVAFRSARGILRDAPNSSRLTNWQVRWTIDAVDAEPSHSHQCACGNKWSHSEPEASADPNSHRCSKCGAEVREVYGSAREVK